MKDHHLFLAILHIINTFITMTTLAKNQISNPSLKTTTVKDFMVNNGFVSVHREVRENQNGYPFITFINADNKAENIYFSKGGAEMVAAGEMITKELIAKFQVAETTNAAGEPRIKLVRKGSGERLELSDLF